MMFSPVLTVTDSPLAKGLSGKKLPPRPSEWAAMWPGCKPVDEPLTATVPMAPALRPRKLICVPGMAQFVPGLG